MINLFEVKTSIKKITLTLFEGFVQTKKILLSEKILRDNEIHKLEGAQVLKNGVLIFGKI